MSDELLYRQHEVSYRLRLSVRYHHRRLRFFDGCDLWAKALSVLAGTAAVAALWKQQQTTYPDVALWIAAAITVLNTLALVFGFASKARLHSDLARRYLELEAALLGNADPTLEDLAKTESTIRQIEAGEPPPLGALVTLCQNELARQEGHEDRIVKIPWHQRLLAQFFDFQAAKPGMSA